MTPEQIQQVITTLTEMKGDMKVVINDMGEVKNHLKEQNGKISKTHDRVTILETEFAPIKKVINRVIGTIVAGFLGTLSYIVFKK